MFDYASAFDCVDHNKLYKIIKEMGIPDHLTCLLRNMYAGQKQQLELDMEQQTGSKFGKEYNKAWLYFLGSKITADGDCSHEIKRGLLAYWKAETLLCQQSSV